MNVLFISTDRLIFDPASEVHARMRSYATLFSRMDVIVLSTRGHGVREVSLGENARAVATNSASRLGMFFDALRLARDSSPDVVSSQDPFEAGLIGYIIARRTKSKFQAQIHTDFLSPAFRSGFLNRIRLRIASLVIPRADCIRVVSERIRLSLARAYRELPPITVLPVSVDIASLRERVLRFPRKHPAFETVAVVVSRLERERNVSLAIRSFAKALGNRPGAGLVVVGSGREMPQLRRLAASLGVGGKVVFEGAQKDVAPYYAYADVVLNTSRYEGYGRAIIEALAAGVPVVSTDVGVAREAGAIISDEGGFPEAIRSALQSGRNASLKVEMLSKDAYLAAYRDQFTPLEI